MARRPGDPGPRAHPPHAPGLGAITRGQRDSQTAMGGDDQALFRESDNLESLYAKAALRRFYIALWRGNIPGWSLDRFEDATGLKLVHEGNLKENLPPMPRFLNRLLALPIDEQNALFAELEARIAENIEQAVEAGSFEVGVETVRADSLAIAGREPLYEHPGTGAVTELVEIIRRDRLEPLDADTALGIGAREPGADGNPRLAVNTRSKRAAVLLPAPSRMFDDGGVQERVRLVRPATRESMAKAELDASNWRRADEAQWRMLWEHEIAGLPSHRESRFWLAAGLLLPVWDRLPAENMRVRRLATDSGEALIGRVLDAEQVAAVRTAFEPRRRPGHDRCGGLRGGHGAGLGTRPCQWLAARPAAHHGRRPSRDRGAGRYRYRAPEAHRLHGRDRDLARPRLRPRRRGPRPHPRTLAARRLIFRNNTVAPPPAPIHIAGRAAAGTAAPQGEPHVCADAPGQPELLFCARL